MLQNDQNQLDYAMLPFVMRDLVNMVMKKKMLPLRDALYYIYSSKLYKSLLDLNTKLWYSSTLSLYEALEKEKTEQRKIQGDESKVSYDPVRQVSYPLHSISERLLPLL